MDLTQAVFNAVVAPLIVAGILAIAGNLTRTSRLERRLSRESALVAALPKGPGRSMLEVTVLDDSEEYARRRAAGRRPWYLWLAVVGLFSAVALWIANVTPRILAGDPFPDYALEYVMLPILSCVSMAGMITAALGKAEPERVKRVADVRKRAGLL